MPLNMNTIGTGNGCGVTEGMGSSYGYSPEWIPERHSAFSTYDFTSINTATLLSKSDLYSGIYSNNSYWPPSPNFQINDKWYCFGTDTDLGHHLYEITPYIENNSYGQTETIVASFTANTFFVYNGKYIIYTNYDSNSKMWFYKFDGSTITQMIRTEIVYELYPASTTGDVIITREKNSASSSYLYINVYRLDECGNISLETSSYKSSSDCYPFEYRRPMIISGKNRLLVFTTTYVDTYDAMKISEYQLNWSDGRWTSGTKIGDIATHKLSTKGSSYTPAVQILMTSHPTYNKFLCLFMTGYSSSSTYLDAIYSVYADHESGTITAKNLSFTPLRMAYNTYDQPVSYSMAILPLNGKLVLIDAHQDYPSSTIHTVQNCYELNGSWTSASGYSLITIPCLKGDTIYTEETIQKVVFNGTDINQTGKSYKIQSDGTYQIYMEMPDSSRVPAVIVVDKNGCLYNTRFKYSDGKMSAYLISGMSVNGTKLEDSGYIDLLPYYNETGRISIAK